MSMPLRSMKAHHNEHGVLDVSARITVFEYTIGVPIIRSTCL